MVSNAVKELQSAKKQLIIQISGLQKEISKIDSAIATLSSLPGASAAVAAPVVASTGKRTMSAAARKAISEAVKARWAKINAAKATAVVAKPAKKKYKMSAAAKAKLSAFQKARWAKINAAKKK